MPNLPIVPGSNHIPYTTGRDFKLGDFICRVIGTRRIFITRAKAHYMDMSAGTRYYHNFGHALDVAAEVMLASYDVFIERPQEMLIAAIYHDAIFVPGAKDNEERSAVLALEEIKFLELQDIDTEFVAGLIRLTSTHFGLASSPEAKLSDEEAIFMDADIHGFAAPWEIFVALQDKICQESLKITGEEPRRSGHDQATKNQLNFLALVLELPHIFYSKRGREIYEIIARDNIKRYLALGTKSK